MTETLTKEKATDPLENLEAIRHPHKLSIVKSAEAGGGVVVRHGLTLDQFDAPRIQKSGVACHQIQTLTDLLRYVAPLKRERTVGFYTPEQVRIVLDETEEQHQLIDCTLARSNRFLAWYSAAQRSAESGLAQSALVRFIRQQSKSIDDGLAYFRAHYEGDPEGRDIPDDMTARLLVSVFECLRGTLTHDAAESRMAKSRAVSFSVKTVRRGGRTEEVTVNDVPTSFPLLLPILADDRQPTLVWCSLEVVGAEGAEPRFRIELEDIADVLANHLESRLGEFAAEAGFTCVRGTYRMAQPAELGLPKQAAEFLDKHAKLIAAQAGSTGDDD